MKKNILFWFLLIHSIPTFSQVDLKLSNFLTDSLTIITNRVQKRIIPTRYMEGTLIQKTDTLKGWEGIEVSLYSYKVTGTNIIAKVYLADADSKRIATWVISTCVTITGNLLKANTDKLIKSIRDASGGQFPVLGMVYEDMDGKGQKNYIFKDGVTVFLKNKTSDNLALINDVNIKSVGKYARIISTTREEYIKKFGNSDLSSKNWLKVVRDEYKKALKSDYNNLMIAWGNGRLK
ncbi:MULTISPECIES: hypothetical protein [Emticicia]|uniref:hypothetical protein n=1 Tax=Emticicia TaxID=312278 RepID=UPI0007D8A64B|nr:MULTISPECIES: hypothetical protein [Emticicia]